MNYEEFIKKLAAGSAWRIEHETRPLVGNLEDMELTIQEHCVSLKITKIPLKQLIQNMDLLARELHMEVEKKAMVDVNKRIRKHQRIGTNLKFDTSEEDDREFGSSFAAVLPNDAEEMELKWKNI